MTTSQVTAAATRTVDDLILLAPETVFAESYIIEERIGLGDIALVYKCHQIEFPSRPLALKILRPSLASDRTSLTRFYKGYLTANRVNHPNVLRVHEYVTDDRIVGYVMEFASGGNLEQLFSSDPKLPLKKIIEICKQTCAGLQAIHDTGAIHRNLGPSQIYFNEAQNAKLAGFGMVHTNTGPRLTKYGNILGSIEYVSPEYIGAGKLDYRSDIYGLGLIAYRMITGALPFAEINPIDAISKRMINDPSPPSYLRKECPEELSRIVMKAISRDPDLRYNKAEEMQKDLEALASCPIEEQPVQPLPEESRPEETIKTEDTLYQSLESLNDHETSGTLNLPVSSSETLVGGTLVSGTLVGRTLEADILKSNSTAVLQKTHNRLFNKMLRVVSLLTIFGCSYILYNDSLALRTRPASITQAKIASNSTDKKAPSVIKGQKLKIEQSLKKSKKAKKAISQRGGKNKQSRASSVSKQKNEKTQLAKTNLTNPAASVFVPESIENHPLTPVELTHTVAAGETLIGISAKYSVTPRQLIKLNKIKNPRQLSIGTLLKIPN